MTPRTCIRVGYELRVLHVASMSPKDDAEREYMSKVPYASAVGSLMYAMVCTRPDISQAVGVVSRYMHDPGKEHWEAVKWIPRYILNTVDVGLVIQQDKQDGQCVVGYCDSDYAEAEYMAVTEAVKEAIWLQGLFGELGMEHKAHSWKSTLQSTVALSTTEAEYMAVTEAVKEAIWLQGLFGELGMEQKHIKGMEQKHIKVHCDTEAAVRKYQFDVGIRVKNVSRLCHAKPIVTVNGRHGLKQFRNGWADGPAYITQCPFKTGHSYTYDFNVTGQRGTLWWQAHILWLRATVYGAIAIMPKEGTMFPFPQPWEWWNSDVETLINQANKLGLPPPTSDAHMINGKPGPLFPYTLTVDVEARKTYLLRIINAALNDELFFSIGGHNMTVVEIDAVYTKPFTTRVILIAPSQTNNVLIKPDQPPSRYFMAARPFMDAPVPVDNKTVAGSELAWGTSIPPRTLQSSTSSILPREIQLECQLDGGQLYDSEPIIQPHTMWGLKMAFVVENGKSPEESIIPPPKDLLPC
ncbi:Laccase-10 [Hibiscus syriacus]|uniref:laccase n=1 Tax=Hibiscus syriacus TaxID=106335 RepID=A0A6A2YD53_HIBSY|nr:Laccase-10 [Hibiscus syriacus]